MKNYYRPKDLAECLEHYGPCQRGPDQRLYWPGERTWVKPCYLPREISQHLKSATTHQPVERIFCNSDMHEPLLDSVNNILTAKVAAELKTFDGCLNVRFVRGSDFVLSYHSYALAIDFNAKDNPLGGKSAWSDAFVRCFTDVGWVWGGDFKDRSDPMHFQWVGFPRRSIRSV